MVATIVIGCLSDRTRSRFGKRNPWIFSGGFPLALAATAMSFTSNFALLVSLWIVFRVGLAVVLAPLFAVLPDRFAPKNLGKTSTLISLGQLVAQSLGSVAAGALISDNAARPGSRSPLARCYAASFSPKDRDFILALVGRFPLLSLMSVLLYQLYVLTDYVKLSLPAVGAVVATGGILLGVSSGAGTLLATPISDEFGKRKAIVIGASFVSVMAETPLAMTSSLAAFYVFILVGGFACGMYVAVDQALLAEVLPSTTDRAKGMGMLAVANTDLQELAPIISGLIVTAVGCQAVFVVAIVLAVISALALLPLRRVA
ncbi:MFS transporter [Streptomyces sp. NPDC047841]|uniref:MFS transporter n=1 Tax=Streptomyces sp. NPDC047841 TaxID=3154708 RepID=UPI003454DA94